MRDGRRRLVDEELPRLRMPVGPLENLQSLFSDPVSDVWLEIGFGAGEHLIHQAEANPHIGFIGAEPTRAETIDFTAAYVEIEATYLVAEDSRFQTVEDVDSDGVRIAVSGRSAYDLYLSRNLKNAELIRAQGVPGAVDLFKTGDYDALAALRPALVAEIDDLPGTRILDDRFTAVQQAIGTQKGKEKATKFLSDFVEEAKASGFVASLIEKHGVVGRLSVAQPG
mgnify:CR=1 FL=1